MVELNGKKVSLKATDPTKGVKYECGCVAGSDQLVMLMFFPKKCIYHEKPITGFWRK